jgi:hypothetical protein
MFDEDRNSFYGGLQSLPKADDTYLPHQQQTQVVERVRVLWVELDGCEVGRLRLRL